MANPHSGDRSSLSKAEWISNHYSDYFFTIYQTREADDEYKKVAQILEEYRFDKDIFLVIGGDGTLAKVLQVWPETEPLAYLPAGSGNDFVRDIGQQTAVSLMEAVEKSEIRDIFVFQSENQLILNSLGLGFDAHIISQAEDSRLKNILNYFHLGKLTYLFFAVQSIFRKEGISVSLIDENGQSEKFCDIFLFVLANTAYFGGGIMVWPESSSQTEDLDLLYLKKGSLFHHLAGLLALVFRKHQQSKRLHHQTYSGTIQLECLQPTLAQINGESIVIQKESFTCRKRRIYIGKE